MMERVGNLFSRTTWFLVCINIVYILRLFGYFISMCVVGTNKSNYLASHMVHLKNYIDRIKRYDEFPKRCITCQSALPYPKRKNKYCSQRCNGLSPERTSLGGRRASVKYCKDCKSVLLNRKNTYCQECIDKGIHLFVKRITDVNHAKTDSTRRKCLIQAHGHTCMICSNSYWNGVPIPLELDHIDGDSQNNALINLRVVCPNCHALTPTYKGKNKGNGRVNRLKR